LGQGPDRNAHGKLHLMGFAIAPDLQLQPFGKKVYAAHADAVKTARYLVRVRIELTPGVEHGHDDLRGGDTELLVYPGRDAASVVDDGDRIIDVYRHFDRVAVAREGLVNRIVDHLVNKMVQP